MTVVAVTSERPESADVVLKGPVVGLREATLTSAEIASTRLSAGDGGGLAQVALAGLWGKWMDYATPRIRSAVLATKPLEPFAHQDEAVFQHMLPQPRLRFLLADEPGTGKTIMAGMYMAEGVRRPPSRKSMLA